MSKENLFFPVILSIFLFFIFAGCIRATENPAEEFIPPLIISTITIVSSQNTPAGEEKIANVVFNGQIKVKEIIWRKAKDGNISLTVPQYRTRQGITYPQINFLNEELMRRIGEVIAREEAEVTADYEVPPVEFNITSWQLFSGGSSRGVRAEVTFNRCLAISCAVREGKKGPWVAWPSRSAALGQQRIKQVIIVDWGLRRRVENVLLERYAELVQELGGDDLNSQSQDSDSQEEDEDKE